MNIVAVVKSAVDEAELQADGSGHPVLRGAATKMSNFDRLGVEEAMRQKDANGGSVTVVTLGGPESKGAIKDALAMGATKGLHIVTGASQSPDSLGTAYCLAKAIKAMEGVDLVFCSEGASDTYGGEVGAMMAEFLGLPFLPDGRKVETKGGVVRCEQSSESGVRVLEARLPAVVSIAAGANKPRFPTLVHVMVAAKKPIEEATFDSFRDGGYPETGFRVLDITLQTIARKNVVFEGSPQAASEKLVAALKEASVI